MQHAHATLPHIMALPAQRTATYADLLAVPDHMVGEIVNGELVTSPRPSVLHAAVSSALGEELGPPFKRGKGGPGGWIILDEPELHFRNREALVPDLAGWRRERLPEVPDTAAIDLAPDWVCEVLSPSTERLDRGDKRSIYARERVAYLWFVNPSTRLLEVLKLDGDTYRVHATYSSDERVRAEPFDAIELDLGILWAR